MTTHAKEISFSPFYEELGPSEPLYTKNGFEIVRCKRSGLVYIANPLSDEELEEFYSPEYFEGEESRQGYASYEADEQVMRRNFRAQLEHVIRHASSRGTLVDVGCAYGYFLDEVKGQFDNVVGIELNGETAAIGRERFGLDITTDPDSALQANTIDVITMWDVIEHLSRPRETLVQCAHALKSGGSLFLTTGDISSPLAVSLGKRWRLINPPQHISYFSIETISALLADIGFEVKDVTRRCGKHVSFGFAFFIAQYLLRRRVQRQPPAWMAKRSVYVNLFDTMLVTAVKR